MKKTTIFATLAAAMTASALPTYEPFTEYAANIATNTAHGQTNSINLCTAGLAAPGGEVWGCLVFSGTAGTNIPGLDIQVTNNSSSVFSSNALSTLLPVNFPGFPGYGNSITTVLINPAQPLVNGASSANIIGNSAVLKFAQDIARPVTGTKTFYVSYLFSVVQKGELGPGNDARYLNFVAATNLVEGKGTSGFYQTWSSMFDTANGTCKYFAHAVIGGGSGFYNLACDNTAGKEFTSSPFTINYNQVQFVVACYTMSANGSDTNTLWVNPSISSFGGRSPPASPIFNDIMPYKVSDIGGMVVDDRIGHGGTEGGIGTNYMANLLLGSTWSYVTGGPEFTLQPTNSILTIPGTTVSLSAAAVAAGQSVTYQWQNNGVNMQNGAGGAGGAGTVSGATAPSLTVTGVSGPDSGTYTLIATASGTGLTLTNTTVVTVSDPGILVQPQPATANYEGAGSFTATTVTTTSSISYAWYNGSTMLVNGLQADGSTVTGAQGTNTGGPLSVNLTLTITNVTCLDAGSYMLMVTNASGSTASSVPASLTVNDPYIEVQPPATVETVAGGTVNIPVVAAGTGATYQWFNQNSGQLSDTGDDSGVTTPTLTISGVQAADVGTYTVQVSGSCGPSVTSSNAVLYIDTVPTGLTLTPPALTQQVGTHLALVGTVSGGSGLIHLLLTRNGTNVNAGQQADGSFAFGPGTTLIGPGVGSLILSNLQVTDSGTYTVIASNAAGMVSASSIITVVPSGQISLSTNNLIVSRVGEGSQPLSGATGNTLYLDQFATNGGYVNTVMVPDSGPGALIVAGGAIASGNEGAQEAYITASSNQQYLNFGGFCWSYPFTGGADVTIGQQATGGSTADVRGIYAINGAGIMALVYTNYGLYSGGHGFRDVYSTDGLTNFWTTGSAGAGTVKYVNAGPAGASYTITTPGQGIPALSAAASGGVCLGLVGTNLVFADNETDGDASLSSVWGLDQFIGAPKTANTNTTEILPGGVGHADDFAFSPDLNTVYLADDDISTGAGGNGGIQRWDLSGGSYQYAYNLSDNTGTGTNGTRGLVVVWPSSITSWGPGVEGAVIYATTSETESNRIIQITDNAGASSTATVLATAGPHQFYRGIRFGPIQVPLSATAGPANQSAIVGQSVALAAATPGNFSYYFPNATGTGYNLISVPPATFQWYDNGVAVPGATSLSLMITNAQASNAGSYTFVMSTSSAKVSNSVPAVLTVNPFGINSNLVAWIQLDDGSGTNAVDSSVYADTGALYDFPTNNSEWVAGLGGLYALNFANADSNGDNTVLIPDAPQLNFSNAPTFTLSAWINSGATNQASAALISKGYGNGGEQFDLDIYAGYLRFFVRNPTGAVSPINSGYYPPLNQWVHVAAVMDGGSGEIYLYVNGQVIGSNTAPTSLLYTSYPLSIGNRTASSITTNSLPFLGEMQDVRVYNVPLGPQNIQAVYASQDLPVFVSPPPRFNTNSPAAFVSNGQLQFTLSGTPDTTFRLWSTTDLALTPVTNKWTLVTSGTFNSSGAATYLDTTATGAGKFYIVTQP